MSYESIARRTGTIAFLMQTVDAQGWYPGHLDGTPSNALEQDVDDDAQFGVSILRSKKSAKVIGRIVWVPTEKIDGGGVWHIQYHNSLRRPKMEQLALSIASGLQKAIQLVKV